MEIVKQDITLAKSSIYPVVSFNSGASYNTSRLQINDFPMPGANVSNSANINYFANFTVGFKIFDGGKVKRAIQAVQIQEDIASLNMAKLKHQLTQELANNYETLDYILAQRRWRNSVLDAESDTSFWDSDHYPIKAMIEIKLKA